MGSALNNLKRVDMPLNKETNLKYVKLALAKRLECSPIVRETWVRSQVESYQRLKKWYLMPPCLTLSIIRYGSRVKWSNPGKGVAPSPTPWCSKLSEREPSGHPRLWSPTFFIVLCIFMQNHNDIQIKTSEDFFKRIYLSLYLKTLCVWEGAGDRTELQYIDPHSYGHQRCRSRSPGLLN